MPKAPPAPPPEAAELVECLGVAGAVRLIEERGGVRVHVPRPEHAHRSYLAGFLPADGLLKLASALGGSSISVPLCREWRARLLLHEGGRSHAEIARLVSATDNWVRKLVGTDWTPLPRAHKALRDARPRSAAEQMELPLR